MQAGGTADRPTLTLKVPPERMGMLKARLGESLPVGNEGAGTVIAAGEGAEGLVGKRVGMLGGAMYATHRRLRVRDTITLPDDATSAEGASMFVNPLTALAMVDTMRAENHKALIHTAAASNLGQMLNRICQADGVPLVNIVRSPDQAQLLRDAGATYVVDSSAGDFRTALTDAVAETGATVAFDAIGGGKLGNAILHAIEAAANRNAATYSRYGSTQFKQLYIYGGLDVGPTILDRGFGFAWAGQRLPAHPVPHQGRAGADAGAEGPRRPRTQDDLCQPLPAHDRPGGGTEAGDGGGVSAQGHRAEVSDRSQPLT